MNLIEIESAQDSRLDEYRSLTDTALRLVVEPAGGLYIAESAKVIERALRAGHRPRSVMVARRWADGIRSLLAGYDVPVYLVPDDVAEAVAGFAVHRGALAAMHRPQLPSVSELLVSASTILMLEGIGDHANVGAAFRAAAGLGADAVLVSPNCADPLYRRSVRVSMGTVFQVPWTRLEHWDAGITDIRGAGFELVALALTSDAVALDAYAHSRTGPVVLMLGSEGDGLSDKALSCADTIVTIPMSGGVDSLNVAAAAAVALWALRH
ncbi:MAG: RNA methyltransferase [Microbacterium sp.]